MWNENTHTKIKQITDSRDFKSVLQKTYRRLKIKLKSKKRRRKIIIPWFPDSPISPGQHERGWSPHGKSVSLTGCGDWKWSGHESEAASPGSDAWPSHAPAHCVIACCPSAGCSAVTHNTLCQLNLLSCDTQHTLSTLPAQLWHTTHIVNSACSAVTHNTCCKLFACSAVTHNTCCQLCLLSCDTQCKLSLSLQSKAESVTVQQQSKTRTVTRQWQSKSRSSYSTVTVKYNSSWRPVTLRYSRSQS